MEALGKSLFNVGLRRLSTLRSVQFLHVQHEFHEIIKWNKPEKLEIWDAQKSCDLKRLPKIDPDWLKLEFRPFAHIIEKLSEEDQKLFTVGLGRRKDGIDVIMKDTTDLVRRHNYDKSSTESKIAWMTVKIRNYQALLPVDRATRKNGRIRNSVKELIEKRKMYLNKLRLTDYKRFEWIIEVLSLIYQPNPEFLKERIERKKCLTKLTDMYCDAIKHQRLEEYKTELEKQKVPFLEEKLATLQRIKEDEDSMRVPCSVEEDIRETIKRLEVLKNTFMEIRPLPDHPPLVAPN